MVENSEKETETIAKFQKFASGKMNLEVGGEQYQVSMRVEERLPVLQYLVMSSKTTESEKLISEELLKQIKLKLVTAFKRNYQEVPNELMEEFVDKGFEQIVGGVAMESGWTSKEQIVAAAEKHLKKKQLNE